MNADQLFRVLCIERQAPAMDRPARYESVPIPDEELSPDGDPVDATDAEMAWADEDRAFWARRVLVEAADTAVSDWVNGVASKWGRGEVSYARMLAAAPPAARALLEGPIPESWMTRDKDLFAQALEFTWQKAQAAK